MGENQHNAADAFVKKHENELASLGGRAPMMEDRYMKFDACMANNGYHAQEFAKSLTKGLDQEAFPVRGDADVSQD